MATEWQNENIQRMTTEIGTQQLTRAMDNGTAKQVMVTPQELAILEHMFGSFRQAMTIFTAFHLGAKEQGLKLALMFEKEGTVMGIVEKPNEKAYKSLRGSFLKRAEKQMERKMK